MPSISVTGVVQTKGLFFIAQRKPGGSLSLKWEFPGGKVDENESSTQALIREFQEELDVPVVVGDLFYTGAFKNNGKEYSSEAYFVSMESTSVFLKEHLAYRWCTLIEIAELDLADSDRMIVDHLIKLQSPKV